MMNEFIITLLMIVFIGIVVLLCFFCCFLANKSDEYWREKRIQMEKNKNGKG